MQQSLTPAPTLQDPIQLGAISCPNRIFMAPLTRCRASAGRVPNAMMGEYYRQRASAGLILSEATAISPQGVGYPDTPGIWSEAQVAAWREIVAGVHAEGGRIILQLWHVGRISDPVYLDGAPPVAPSAIAPPGYVSLIRPKKPFAVPRALDHSEIAEVIEEYRIAAENARTAGFDGVELHGANGYLPEQFLLAESNQRTDEYGGPVENRARFMLEALDAAISVWGSDRVGLHLSPQDEVAADGKKLPSSYEFVAGEAHARGIAFLFLREDIHRDGALTPQIRKAFPGPLVINQELSREAADAALASGLADAAGFGRDFIANPDLPTRFQLGASLNPPQPQTFYSSGPTGYTDYPALADVR